MSCILCLFDVILYFSDMFDIDLMQNEKSKKFYDYMNKDDAKRFASSLFVLLLLTMSTEDLRIIS